MGGRVRCGCMWLYVGIHGNTWEYVVMGGMGCYGLLCIVMCSYVLLGVVMGCNL